VTRPRELQLLEELFGHSGAVTETVGGWQSYCPVARDPDDPQVWCEEPMFVAREEDGGLRFEPDCGHPDAYVRAALDGWEEAGQWTAEASSNGTGPDPDGGERRVVLTAASAITSERVRWLWRGRIARRSATVVAGEKGLGKSALTNASIPADLSRGKLPGDFEGEPLDVLVATAEDGWSTVVKPRLEAAGADLKRVHRLEVHDGAGRVTLTLPDDVSLIAANVEALRKQGVRVGAVVVDPIGAFLSEQTDSHKDASVRRALAPLARMAEELDLAVIIVMHLTKDESGRLINRVGGSGAFVNFARSVLAVMRDPDDPDGEQGTRRVLLHVAANWGRLAGSRAISIEEQSVMLDDGSPATVPVWTDEGDSAVTVEDLQGGKEEEGRTEVEEAIAVALADGRRLSHEVKAEVAAHLHVSRSTVERRARGMVEAGKLLVYEQGEREEGAKAPRRFTEWELIKPGDEDA
jgi:hypothetical protein